MKIFADLTIIAAKDWWEKKSPAGQEKYLKQHKSKLKKTKHTIDEDYISSLNMYGETTVSKVQKLAEQISKELDYDTKFIHVKEGDNKVRIGSKTLEILAEAEKITGNINVYFESVKHRGKYLPNELRGLMAHEIQHQKYDLVRKYFTSGQHKELDFYKKYSHFQGNEEIKMMNELKNTGYVSTYAGWCWDNYGWRLAIFMHGYDQAINETLAEIARLKVENANYKAPDIWEKLYNQILMDYDKLKRRNK